MYYGVDYIFTEYFFDLFKLYIDLTILFESAVSVFLYVAEYLLFRVMSALNFCPWEYQFTYGVSTYILIFRILKAKRTKNWKPFYGNSILNWFFLNLAIFNKFLFNRNLLILVKTKLVLSTKIVMFWIQSYLSTSVLVRKIMIIFKILSKKIFLFAWTPLFKRSSYISFTTFLKRFTKRK